MSIFKAVFVFGFYLIDTWELSSENCNREPMSYVNFEFKQDLWMVFCWNCKFHFVLMLILQTSMLFFPVSFRSWVFGYTVTINYRLLWIEVSDMHSTTIRGRLRFLCVEIFLLLSWFVAVSWACLLILYLIQCGAYVFTILVAWN